MIGCLLIHGFTGSPKEIEPLAHHLINQGIEVITPVLAGHNGSREDFKKSRWKDWVQSAEQALQQLIQNKKSVFVIGFSMGGLIAAHLATRYPVEKLVLLSPAMYSPNFKQLLEDIREGFLSANRKGVVPECITRYMKKGFKTPLRALWQFRQLVIHLSTDLPRVQVPTLIIHGNRDEVVHPRSAKYIFDTIASSEKLLHFLPNSKHIVCHDQERETVKTLVQSFISGESKLRLG